MEPVTLASLLLTSLAGLATATKAWLEARKAKLDLDQARLKAAQATRDADAPTTEEDQRAVQQLVIDPELLEKMTKEMQREVAKFAAITEYGTPEQIDEAAREAHNVVCKHLRIVKDHNDQKLPEGLLQALWTSYRCDQPQPPNRMVSGG
jgi:hypothetical protein